MNCTDILNTKEIKKRCMPEVFQQEEPLSLEKLERPGWSLIQQLQRWHVLAFLLILDMIYQAWNFCSIFNIISRGKYIHSLSFFSISLTTKAAVYSVKKQIFARTVRTYNQTDQGMTGELI